MQRFSVKINSHKQLYQSLSDKEVAVLNMYAHSFAHGILIAKERATFHLDNTIERRLYAYLNNRGYAYTVLYSDIDKSLITGNLAVDFLINNDKPVLVFDQIDSWRLDMYLNTVNDYLCNLQ